MNEEQRPERLELELLVTRCRLGEPEAFDALVDRWHGPLWRYVRSVTGDAAAAEEVLQDTWLRILRGIDRLRDATRLRSWLFSIARCALLDRLRMRYAHAAEESLEEEPSHAEPAPEPDWDESELLHEAIASLPLIDRDTIVLFYLRELDLREVSEVLAIPVGTVKSRLNRARRHLREQLDRKGFRR